MELIFVHVVKLSRLKTKEDMMLATKEPTLSQRQREFEHMQAETRRRAYSMALQLTRNASEAEDLVQETYIKAWRAFDSYLPGRPFLNWILRIMQRAYLDFRRRDNPVRKAESLNSMLSPSDGEVQEIPIPDERANPADELEKAELGAEILAALEELPDVYRDAIRLCDLERMSYSEIADDQNTTVGTVRSRIHRGRKLLRDALIRRGMFSPEEF
ncbi:MAG: sigma-70 family RNA polymerase sigma factor [Fimbriimonadaceae bacterium]|nr:sigma-70 family RNA polymerase sigma factor [Fimbriimonadaceae bacterium]